MDLYRSVTLAACPVIPTPVCPEARVAFQAAARIEAGVQKLAQLHWKGEQKLWNAGRGERSEYEDFQFAVATGTDEDLLRSWETSFNEEVKEIYSLSVKGHEIGTRAEVWRDQDREGWNVAWKE